MTGAIADCERIFAGFWGQPVNTVTTLGFVAAALVVAVGSDRAWVAWGLVVTGFGSFVFHGPMPPWAQWAHDVSLMWLLVVAGASGRRWERVAGLPALVVLSLVVGLLPALADPVAVVAAVVAVGAILWRDRSLRTAAALALLALGAVVGRLSATGGPWCQAESLLQGHGFWHLAAAGAVAVWATGYPKDRT